MERLRPDTGGRIASGKARRATELQAATFCAPAIRFKTFATVAASHLPPRAVAIPRPFKAAAISRRVA